MTAATQLDLESRMATLEAEVAALKEKLDDAETFAAVERGLDEINRGLCRPAKEVVEELRAKRRLPCP